MLDLIGDRKIACEALSVAYFDRLSLSPEDMLRALDGWRIVALASNGEIIGAVAVRGNVGHIGILPAWRMRWGGRRELLALCRHFGVSRTSVAFDNQRSMRWLERWGWQNVGCDNFGVNYELPATLLDANAS